MADTYLDRMEQAEWKRDDKRVSVSRTDPEYGRRHRMVGKARGSAKDQRCIACDGDGKEWAQIHETSGDEPDHYQAMCHQCHQKYDGKWDAEERRDVSSSLLIYWDSPEGMARREDMKGHNRAAGKRTPEQHENIKRGTAEGRRLAAERRLAAIEGGGLDGVR